MYRHDRIALVDPTANKSRKVDTDEVHIALRCVLRKVTRALEEHVPFFLHGCLDECEDSTNGSYCLRSLHSTWSRKSRVLQASCTLSHSFQNPRYSSYF